MVKIGLIGIGGFGQTHLATMDELDGREFVLAAVAEKNIEANDETIKRLKSRGTAIYRDYIQMLETEKDLDFVAVATSLPLHPQMAVDVMTRGHNLLLEKPPAVTIQDIDRLIKVQRETGRWCQVDFQNTTGEAFNRLWSILAEGGLGRIKTITAAAGWTRYNSYFTRNYWAGRLTANGNYVLDGPLNNALSHLMNNCLCLASGKVGKTAEPVEVTAELYRGNDWNESEDTSCIRVKTKNGVEIYYFVTFCIPERNRFSVPFIEVEGENGSAFWNYDNYYRISYTNGEVQEFRGPEENLWLNIYKNCVKYARGETDRLYSPLCEARNFVLASNGAFKSSGKVHLIPGAYKKVCNKSDGDFYTEVSGIEEVIRKAAEQKRLFSELGVEWAVETRPFSLAGFDRFEL